MLTIINTNLSIYRKKNIEIESSKCFWSYLSLLLTGLLCSECSPDILLTFIIYQNPSFGFIIDLSPNFCKSLSKFISVSLSLHIFLIAVTPATFILCLVVIQVWCQSFTKNVSPWLPIIFQQYSIESWTPT